MLLEVDEEHIINVLGICEECEQRIEVTETDIEVITKDIERLEFELNDLKLKISKEFI